MHVDYPTIELRPVPGFPGYSVCRIGVVFTTKRNQSPTPLSWTLNKGYPCVQLVRNGNKFHIRIHSLILLTFVGPCPEGMECRHLDDVKTNNFLSNLKWGTRLENRSDMIANTLDRIDKGTNSPKSKFKLTKLQIKEIRESPEPARRLAARFNISDSHAQSIRRGRRCKRTKRDDL